MAPGPCAVQGWGPRMSGWLEGAAVEADRQEITVCTENFPLGLGMI